MATLKERLSQLTELKHRLAVWEALYGYLDDSFISKAGTLPRKAIKASGCLVEVVPEEIIEEILSHIASGPIDELKAGITEIEDAEIPEGIRRRRRHNNEQQDQDKAQDDKDSQA